MAEKLSMYLNPTIEKMISEIANARGFTKKTDTVNYAIRHYYDELVKTGAIAINSSP